MMKKNVIILTGGLSGSSVLTALISRSGYWFGHDTKSVSYNTYENSQLVELNQLILKESGYLWPDVVDIPPPSVDKIEEAAAHMNLNPFKAFISECKNNTPWIWKDPRLCYTIFFWKKLIDFKNCKFLLMTRDIQQTWAGMLLRAKIPMPFDKLKTIEHNCIINAQNFFRKSRMKFLALTFEDLILHPNKSIDSINKFLNINLDVRDLELTYNGPLRVLRWSKMDYLKVNLKFLYYKYILRDIIKFPQTKEGS